MQINSGQWEHIHAHASEAYIYESSFPSPQLQAFIRFHVASYLNNFDHSQCTWLEYGCGTGAGVVHALSCFPQLSKILLLDVAPTALSTCLSRLHESVAESQQISTHLLRNPTDDLPFTCSSVHILNAESSLYYNSFDDFLLALNNIFSVLAPNSISRFYIKADDDRYARTMQEISPYTYLINAPEHWEDQMILTCLPYDVVVQSFSMFTTVMIGKESYSYSDLNSVKSFWVVTAIK